jgi:predicted ribosome quality control (RQC) complex YloA/Tae2 family protein
VSLNWVEIDKVLEELSLTGSFLQNVRQADYHHFYFEFYSPGRPRQVLVSLAPQRTRVHEVAKRPATLVRPPRFVEFLRARMVGAQVIEARQLGKERLVLWKLQTKDAIFDLWIRLWGGAANLMVTDGGHTIIEAAFRRPASSEVSGGTFDPEAAFAVGPGPEPKKTFALRDLADPDGEPGASYSRKLEVLYAGAAVDDVEKLRDQALRLVDRRLAALVLAREKSKAKLAESARQDDWKTYADVLTSDSWKVKKGDRVFEGVDWRDGTTFRLDLDGKLSAHENAQVLYKRYQKARDGAEGVRQELAGQDAEEAQWHRHAEHLADAVADEIKAFLEKHRTVRGTAGKAKDADARPGLTFQSGPFTLWVGRNAKENDGLLRRYVRGNDLWLHTRDVPGGYVFIRTVKGKTVPLETLLDAGTLAVVYSKAKDEGRADLYYTAVKYLRRAQNGPLGTVLPTQEKNLTVTVDRARLERLHRDREESE